MDPDPVAHAEDLESRVATLEEGMEILLAALQGADDPEPEDQHRTLALNRLRRGGVKVRRR